MRVLVVGGAGYIGSFMARRLLECGHTVVIVDNLSAGNRKSLPPNVEFHEGDIGDGLFLESVMGSGSLDAIMHFAAKIMVGESVLHPDRYYDNNIAKVLTLLDVAVKHKCHTFVFSSSAAVYGNPEYIPIDEHHPANPINPYGFSKFVIERVLMDYCKAYGLRAIALRYFNAAGAALDGSCGESQAVKQNLIPIILANLEKGGTTKIFGNDYDTPDGTCIRDYIHIEDIAGAHLMGLEYLISRPESYWDVFNLGTGNGTSVKEVIDAVCIASGRNVETEIAPRREGDPARLVASSEKAKRFFGWSPGHSDIETIVKSAYRWHFNRLY